MLTAADMAIATPGAEVVTSIADFIRPNISNDDRLDLIVAVERQIAWLTAVQHRLVAQLQPSLIGMSSDDDWVQEELGAALRLAPTTAGNRLGIARALNSRLPATLAALEAGDISSTQAADIAAATVHLDVAHTDIVEQRVLPKAGEQSAAQTRRALKRAVLAVDPSGEVERETRAVEQRRVVLIPGADGMADLKAYLPAAGARALMTALRGVADKARTAGDNRTLDQRQADALVDLGFAVLDSGALPTHHGRPSHLGLTVTARTLSGEDDVPGELDGYGPISAGAARKLIARYTSADNFQTAASAYSVDATGQLQGAPPPDSDGYRLPATLSRFVLARIGTAPSHTAPFQQYAATWTISWPSAWAVRVVQTICIRCAGATIERSMKPGGKLADNAMAVIAGQRRTVLFSHPCRHHIRWTVTAIIPTRTMRRSMPNSTIPQ